MVKHILILSSLLVWPSLGLALCPETDGDTAKRQALMAALKVAPNEASAQQLSAQLWQEWLSAPDQHAQDLLNEGMQRRGVGDFAGAIVAFDALIAYCPTYAEGYNQRAFASFLRRDFAAALVDLDEALARRPDHIGALSGRALTLFGLERDAEGQDVLRDALELNPWLSERHLLRQPEGEEL